MTYIKEVELDNFKSFAGHNKFSFTNGFNIIAGPNGSGKSNITDALMFVLGSASKKEMRSEVLTELIFNGGKNQKPSDFAKVNLVFDNSDKTFSNYEEKEVSISRKIDESGKSVFRINGKASTLEEVRNILAIIKVRQDSFNIIPQGKIDQIAVSSPEDRLGIINDLSGISVFEEKKSKAMNEMKKVEDNISTIDTVQGEKKKLMDQLEADKKRAEEFKGLVKKQADLQAKLALLKKNTAFEVLDKVSKEIAGMDEESKGIYTKRTDLDNRLSEIKTEVNRINTEAEREGEKEISEAERRSKESDAKLTKLRAISEMDIQQIGKIKEAIASLEDSIKKLSESSDKENADISEYREKLNSLTTKRRGLTDATLKAERYFKEKELAEKQLAETGNKIYEYKLALANYPRSAELQSKLSELNAVKAKLESDDREMTMKFAQFRPMVEKSRAAIKKEEDMLYWLRENLLNQKAAISAQNRAMDVADGLKKEIAGVHGSIDQLFTVNDAQYARAIYRSIGRRGDFIVVDDESTASKCIEKLKRDKTGSFTFIPLNRVAQAFVGKKPEGPFVIGYTINLVSFDRRFENAMRFVFGDTLLVDTFENAKTLITRYRMVTLDGTVFEKSGTISGGYHEEASFSRITKKYEELNKAVEEHSRLKEKHEEELQEKNATLSFLMAGVKRSEKDLSDIRFRITAVEKELSTFHGSERDISESINKLESQKFELDEKIKGLGADVYERVDYKKEIGVLDTEINRLEAGLGTSTARIENVFKRELADLAKKSTGLEKEKSSFEADLERTNKTISEEQAAMESANKDLRSRSDALQKLRDKRDDLVKESVSVGESLDGLSRTAGELQGKTYELKVKEAEAKVKFETAEEEFKKYAQPDTVIEEGDSIDVMGKKLSLTIAKVEKFGSINEMALDRFNEVLVEYNEFNDKLVKLNEEKERILVVIKDIEAKKMEAFMKTLSDINANLSNVFNSITGGTAEMVPYNPNDVMGEGLDIHVDLPNKKIRSIRSLSGGEKAMLSISILMAISKYIDVPFYVLDEVDGPLDAVNASKFAGIVKAYSEHTQFVIISHNETTLLSADVIYGVTMSSEGVSKIVSVKMPKEAVHSPV